MKVSKDKVVTLTYDLKLKDNEGELVQRVDESRPFVHLFGAGTLLPTFEENLAGLEPGGEFSFSVTSEEAYGEATQEAIVELERSLFEVEGEIDSDIVSVGKMVAMQDENGNPAYGMVLEIKDDSVIMDFNHPLAGKDLFFSGKIIDVRDASAEELSHGHVHGEGGVKH